MQACSLVPNAYCVKRLVALQCCCSSRPGVHQPACCSSLLTCSAAYTWATSCKQTLIPSARHAVCQLHVRVTCASVSTKPTSSCTISSQFTSSYATACPMNPPMCAMQQQSTKVGDTWHMHVASSIQTAASHLLHMHVCMPLWCMQVAG